MVTLVTGITGFIGSEYYKLIVNDVNNEYCLLIRSHNEDQWIEKTKDLDHITIIVGDLLAPDIFQNTNDSQLNTILEKVSRVVHLAALYDLEADYSTLYKVNVIGTQNLLFFIGKRAKIKEIFHASTIAVAGKWKGVFSEEDFDLGQEFPDPYSRTKFEAEKLIREFAKEYPQKNITIGRFGIVVGHSITGEMARVDGPYYLLKQLTWLNKMKAQIEMLPFLYFPYRETSEIPIVPVDFAAFVINNLKKITKARGTNIRVIHIMANDRPTNERFMHDFLKLMGINTKVKGLEAPGFINPIVKLGLRSLSLPDSLSDYMNSTLKITSHELEKELKKSVLIPQYKDFSATILRYSFEHFKF